MPRKDSGYYDAAKISEYNHKYYEMHKHLKGRQKVNALRGRLRDTANFARNNRSFGDYYNSLNKRGQSYDRSLTRHLSANMNREISNYHSRFKQNASLIASRYRNLSPEQKKAHSGEIATQMKLLKESYARGKAQIKDRYNSQLKSERKRLDTSDKYKKAAKTQTDDGPKKVEKHDYELGDLVRKAMEKKPKESKKKAASSGRRGSSGGRSGGSGGGRGSGGSGGSSGRGSSAKKKKKDTPNRSSGAYNGKKKISTPTNTPRNRDAVDTSKNKKFGEKTKAKTNSKIDNINAKRDKAIADLKSQFKAGKISKKEMNDRIKQAKAQAQAQIDAINSRIQAQKKAKAKLKTHSFIGRISKSVSKAKKAASSSAGVRSGVGKRATTKTISRQIRPKKLGGNRK